MSSIKNRPQYLLLLERFILGEIRAAEFVVRFSVMWQSDGDEQWADPARGPAAGELQKSLLAGDISKDEFSNRWRQLWWGEQPESEAWEDFLSRIYSASD